MRHLSRQGLEFGQSGNGAMPEFKEATLLTTTIARHELFIIDKLYNQFNFSKTYLSEIFTMIHQLDQSQTGISVDIYMTKPKISLPSHD